MLGKERHNDMRYGYKYHGKIAEVIVFNSKLNDADLNNINHYLSKKWGLTASVDSDGDGATDAEELAAGSNSVDADSIPLPKLSDSFDAIMGEDSGLSSVDGHVLLWLDGRNIDRKAMPPWWMGNPLIPGTTWPMNKMKWWHRADRAALPTAVPKGPCI